MQNQKKDVYRQWGWFIMAATVVVLLLANTVHASMPVLIVLGVLGFASGVALIAMAERNR